MKPLNLQLCLKLAEVWLECFRLAGGGVGDDIAGRVLFTGGANTANTGEEMSCGGEEGETSHNTPPTESL